MKSRAELLAELEENRWKNKGIEQDPDVLSMMEPGSADGYDPYDNPGLGKEVPDGADITARRRAIILRGRRRRARR